MPILEAITGWQFDNEVSIHGGRREKLGTTRDIPTWPGSRAGNG